MGDLRRGHERQDWDESSAERIFWESMTLNAKKNKQVWVLIVHSISYREFADIVSGIRGGASYKGCFSGKK